MVLQYFKKEPTLETQTNSSEITLMHLAFKTLQLGQGFAAIATIVSVVRSRRILSLFSTYARLLPKATIIAGIATYGLGAYKMTSQPELMPKRKFLLQRNINQNTSDDMLAIGLIAGFVLGALTPLKIIRTTLLGGTVGMVAYSVNRWVLRPQGKDYDLESFFGAKDPLPKKPETAPVA